MSARDIGRICLKKAGREAGRRCVVVDIIDKSFVLVTGPKNLSGVKRRRVNINHLDPLEKKLAIPRRASDEEVMSVIKEEKMANEMQDRTVL